MKQVALKKIKGQIEVVTGLHIGAGNDSIEIGGMDNPIIKTPHNDEPYIPGSSIKGKMRSLTEWLTGKLFNGRVDGDPCACGSPDCEVCRVFGASAANERDQKQYEAALQRGPTRLIIRDCNLSKDSRSVLENGGILLEEKHENSINRITAKANPRPMERVVPGTTFDFELVYRILDTGDGGKTDQDNFEKVVLKALRMLEVDYLGGGGSRGNGRIRFLDLQDEGGNAIDLAGIQI